ncbi:MAG: hypothetical protein Kow00121_29800 [Elainellaceae cyanobacterium]
MSKQEHKMHNRDVKTDNYDPHIIPAETAARKEREGDAYKHPIKESDDPKSESEAADRADIDTDGGYTVDKEGLVNNFAIEPEMYVEVPGDLREKEKQLKAERDQEIDDVNDTDKQGELDLEHDRRGKGTGIV